MGLRGGPFWTPGRRTGAAVALAAAAGGLLGLGGYTFVYAKGGSYLTDDPAACANCHPMVPYLEAWRKGSHHAVATCNDCHTPAGLAGKYATKAINGWNHSLAFTTGDFPENLSPTPSNLAIADRACAKCHADIAEQIDRHARAPAGQACIRCHAGVGHAR